MSHHVVPLKTYITIFVALMVLLLITVGVAFIDFGPLGLLIALTIAAIKALLILLYFMHVRYSSHISWIYAGAGFFWLFILIVLTMSDYLSRSWE